MTDNAKTQRKPSRTEMAAQKLAAQLGLPDIKTLLKHLRDEEQLTLRRVGKRLGVSHDMVFKLTQKYEEPFPRYRALVALEDRLQSLDFDDVLSFLKAREGARYEDMATELGMSKSWIKKQMRKYTNELGR